MTFSSGIRFFMLAWIGAFMSACSTSATKNFPTYPYQGIDLLAGVVGTVFYQNGCYQMNSSSPEGSTFVLIFPQGTRISDTEITLPKVNGGTVPLVATLEAQGGFQNLEEGNFIDNPTECMGAAFIVNRMKIND